MRIALLTTSFPREPGDPAGHFVETEAVLLAQAGHDVHVIAPGRRASVRTVIHRAKALLTIWGAGGESLFGTPGALFRARHRPHRLFELPGFLHSARRLLDSLAPLDHTIAHFLVPCGYPLSLDATGQLEIALHGSDVRLVAQLPSPVRSRIVGKLLDRGARFRFASHDLETRLLATVGTHDRERLRGVSRVELPPIDLPQSGAGYIDRPPGDRRPHWVTCARLIPSKRVDRAIREAARRNVHLTIIGDGPLRTELELLAASFEPRASFVGHLSRTETLSLIASSQKLLHLSDAEGAPTVVREARALGIPVLATAVGDVARWALSDPGIELFRPA